MTKTNDLINRHRLFMELEMKAKDTTSPLIITGLAIAMDMVLEQPATDPTQTEEALAECRKAYQQGYLDGALQEKALGIK